MSYSHLHCTLLNLRYYNLLNMIMILLTTVYTIGAAKPMLNKKLDNKQVINAVLHFGIIFLNDGQYPTEVAPLFMASNSAIVCPMIFLGFSSCWTFSFPGFSFLMGRKRIPKGIQANMRLPINIMLCPQPRLLSDKLIMGAITKAPIPDPHDAIPVANARFFWK